MPSRRSRGQVRYAVLPGILLAVCGAPLAAATDGRLPLSFERRRDLPDESYIARAEGYRVRLKDGSAQITIGPAADRKGNIVNIGFAGGRRIPGNPVLSLARRVRLGASAYPGVTYPGIYPNIDVAYSGTDRQLQLDLVLQPGADPREIRIDFGGAQECTLDTDGALLLATPAGNLRLPSPAVYQQVGGRQRTIGARYSLVGTGQVRLQLESYDRSAPLMIRTTVHADRPQVHALVSTGTPAAYLISTLAGSLLPATTLAATAAAVGNVSGVGADQAGNLYLASFSFNAIFRVAPGGVMTRVAGTGIGGYSGDGGPALKAQLSYPADIAVDKFGNLIITDNANTVIRKVSNGAITTIAGNGASGYAGDGGPATGAELSNPGSAQVDNSGNLYIADTSNHVIRRVSTDGIITTVAGTGTCGYNGDSKPATAAELCEPASVRVDPSGNLYISDTGNGRIRRVAGGTIATIAGDGKCGYMGDGGPATAAEFCGPEGIALDGSGNLYISDSLNGVIRRISGGIISTVAGNGLAGFSGDGGPATSAQIAALNLATDGVGNLYLADGSNGRVRKVAGGMISTVAGGGTGDGTPAPFAGLSFPYGVARDSSGNVYLSDTDSHRVRKITPAGIISTYAGTGSSGYSGDGGPATSAQLNFPEGLALDPFGNLYIADTSNQRIRMVSPAGRLSP